MEFRQEDWNEELEGYVVEVSTLPVGHYVKLLTIHKEEIMNGYNQLSHILSIKAQDTVYQVAGAVNVVGARGTFNVLLDDTTSVEYWFHDLETRKGTGDRRKICRGYSGRLLVTANKKVLAGFAY